MSFLEYNVKYTPSGWRKILYLNWPLIVLVLAVAGVGFLMLTSVAGGRVDRWAEPQMQRFAMGFVLMVIVAMMQSGISTKRGRDFLATSSQS
jgi:rod shape determining protein RodA